MHAATILAGDADDGRAGRHLAQDHGVGGDARIVADT